MTEDIIHTNSTPLGRNRKKGIVLLLVSASFFSFSGIFVKGVSASAADVVFWRALFGAIFMFLWVYFSGRWKTELVLNRQVSLLASLAVICTTTFLMSFKFTSIANVAILYAATPLFAGAFGWVILSEKFPLREILLSILALFGVGVVVFGSLGTVNLLGDTLAIVMSITLALIIVIFRKYPDTSSGAVNVYSCVALVLLFSFFSEPFNVPILEVGILAVFAVFFIVAYVTLQEGSKILPPALVSLLSIMETPLAPVWAWLVLSEIPSAMTVLGGSIIMFAVVSAVVEFKGETT